MLLLCYTSGSPERGSEKVLMEPRDKRSLPAKGLRKVSEGWALQSGVGLAV